MPFPVQRMQSDRGSEFVGLDFQDALRERRIKFRPNRPCAPHLNGKVECSQRTDRREFWSTVDLTDSKEALEEQLVGGSTSTMRSGLTAPSAAKRRRNAYGKHWMSSPPSKRSKPFMTCNGNAH